jgi:hypothetical protein
MNMENILFDGGLIKQRAENMKLSPTKHAAQADVSINTIYQVYAGGNVNVQTLKSAAEVVGLTLKLEAAA